MNESQDVLECLKTFFGQTWVTVSVMTLSVWSVVYHVWKAVGDWNVRK